MKGRNQDDVMCAEERAIERAKRAFLAARTPFARHKAMRRLEQLGVGPPKAGG